MTAADDPLQSLCVAYQDDSRRVVEVASTHGLLGCASRLSKQMLSCPSESNANDSQANGLLSCYATRHISSTNPLTAMKRVFFVLIAGLITLPTIGFAADFASDWESQNDRVWIGSEYWANPLEDWRLHDGRLECTSAQPGRNVHLLTHQLKKGDGTLEMSVVIGLQEASTGEGAAGFEIGIRSELSDYRSSLLESQPTVRVGISTDGALFIKDNPRRNQSLTLQNHVESFREDGEKLIVRVGTGDDGEWQLTVEIAGRPGGLSLPLGDIDLSGNIALTSNGGLKRSKGRFWFRDWTVSGSKVVEHADHAFGPILYSMYTLSRGTMTMTAQMPPVGPLDEQTVVLEVPLKTARRLLDVPGVRSTVNTATGDLDKPSKKESEISNRKPETSDIAWVPIARSTIDLLSATAHFQLHNWRDDTDTPYRLTYGMRDRQGNVTSHAYYGIVRQDPVDKPEISVAGFYRASGYGLPQRTVGKERRHS